MKIASIDPIWDGIIEKEWIQELDDSPFLTACRQGTILRSELDRFLTQHYFYSQMFTRYLCALMANLEDKSDIDALAENLCEELGLTDEHTVPHSKLYQKMLDQLSLNCNAQSVFPSTLELINSMFMHCKNQNPIYGLAALCLGAEAIVPHLYSQIILGFQAHGVPISSLKFLDLHVSCDDDHAITLKKIIEKYLKKYAHEKDYLDNIKQTGYELIQKRINFFDGLLESHQILEVAV